MGGKPMKGSQNGHHEGISKACQRSTEPGRQVVLSEQDMSACLPGNDEEEEHVGEHMREALVQEPGGEPAVGLSSHQGPPARPPTL